MSTGGVEEGRDLTISPAADAASRRMVHLDDDMRERVGGEEDLGIFRKEDDESTTQVGYSGKSGRCMGWAE